MLSGIPHEMMPSLRQQYPRCRLPELIDRVAAFYRNDRDCFASAAYLAKEIGVSKRTVFRYFARLKADGVLTRIPGRRREPPDYAKRKWALKMHGFAWTHLRGALASFAYQGISLLRSFENRKEKARRAKDERQREQRQMHAQTHQRWLADEHAKFRSEFPALAARMDADRSYKPPAVALDVRARHVFEDLEVLTSSYEQAVDRDLCDVDPPE